MKRLFLRKLRACFFSGLKREISSSCRQLWAGCPNVFRRTIIEKHFLDENRKKNWHFSDIFPSFWLNRSSGCVKIQPSTLPDEQLAGKKLLRSFLLCIFVFTLGRQNFVHLGQNRSRLSNRVPKTSPMKRCLWIRKQEEEIGNWAIFSRTVGQKFRRGYQICHLNDHRSIDMYYLFLSVFSLFEMLLILERKSCHTWWFFFCSFLKIVCEIRGPIWGEVFFPKTFCIFFNSLWESNMKVSIFCWKINAGGPNCNRFFQRSIPRIFFDKKVKSLLR